jgi:hypothetical protein
MPNEVKTIIKTASNKDEEKDDKEVILKSMDMCIDTFQSLEDRIKKLIKALAIN